jgi:hypothetical protein
VTEKSSWKLLELAATAMGGGVARAICNGCHLLWQTDQTNVPSHRRMYVAARSMEHSLRQLCGKTASVNPKENSLAIRASLNSKRLCLTTSRSDS